MSKILLAYDYALNSSGTENFGIVEILRNYLNEQKSEYLIHKTKLSANPINLFVKFIILSNFIYRNKSINYFVAYNPVNAFFGYICKILLNRKYKLIFISVDFTEHRFGIFIFDKLYVFLDTLSSKLSDEVWSCSSRVYDYRKKFLSKDKNFYIPNVPTYKKKNLEKFNRTTLLMIAIFSDNYKFDDLILFFNSLKEMNVDLYIVGDGDFLLKEKVINKIKSLDIGDYVKLTGYLPHEEVLKLLEKCHLGLALYNGKDGYNFWGDSMKIREYSYYELPVITTKNVNNYKEVKDQNLGVCLEDFNDLTEAIKFILNKKNYPIFLNSIRNYNSKINPAIFFNKHLKLNN